jgi:hypothetical protein
VSSEKAPLLGRQTVIQLPRDRALGSPTNERVEGRFRAGWLERIGLAGATPAQVVCDREQGVQVQACGHSPPPAEICLEKGPADDLLGVAVVPENSQRVPVDVTGVPPVRTLNCSLLPQRERLPHARDDAARCEFLRLAV